MYGDCIKDENAVRKNEHHPRSFLQDNWYSNVSKPIHQHHEQQVKKEYLLKRTQGYDLGDDIKTTATSDDEFSHFSFPVVGFCDVNPTSTKHDFCVKQPQISDLCKEDKQRIAQLVKEISRYRDEYKDKSLEVKKFQDENCELKSKVGQLEREINALRISLKYSDENSRALTRSQAAKEATLKTQNSELQSKIKELENERVDFKLKLDETQKQIEKLANAVYHVTNENKKYLKKSQLYKEKLKIAVETISQLEALHRQQSSKQTENRSSQTSLDHGYVENRGKPKPSKKDFKRKDRYNMPWNLEQDKDSSDEDSLISELFFIPKQKNLTKPKYSSDDES